jgi:hypothetical protein
MFQRLGFEVTRMRKRLDSGFLVLLPYFKPIQLRFNVVLVEFSSPFVVWAIEGSRDKKE